MNRKSIVIFFFLCITALAPVACGSGESFKDKDISVSHSSRNEKITGNGPLTVHSINPRYFTDASGKTIYLTGSHYWFNLQDGENRTEITPFNYASYLDFIKRYNHNFFLMWSWEQAAWAPWTKKKILFEPLPYERTGPGKALDDGLRFDLTVFNQAYFDRLRS